jgi:hypothetical protein
MATMKLAEQYTKPKPSLSSLMPLVKRFVPTIIEGSIPFATYMLVKSTFHTSDIIALSIGAVIPAVFSVVRFTRSRTIDIVSVLIMLGLVGSIIAALIGGSPQLLLIRESAVGAIMGLAFLVSLVFERPLFFYLARHFRAGNDPEKVAAFAKQWERPALRRAYRIITAVWGIGSLGEFALRIVLVFTLSIPLVLAISAIAFPLIYTLMGLWTMHYVRKAR